MSFKHRVIHRYESILNFLGNMIMPAWLMSTKMKLVLVSLVPVLAFGYVYQINTVSTSGYIIHNLEKKVQAVSIETRQLETQVAEHQSMVSIQKRLSDLAMIMAPKVTFVNTAVATPVAQR